MSHSHGHSHASVRSVGPRVSDPTQQALVDDIWAAVSVEVDAKMVAMETEMIKRHNMKMMNEMQEVVRQIKTAKAKNDEVLRDYHKKHSEMTRAMADLADKYISLRTDLDETKRQVASTKQQLTLRCDQCVEQLNQLKQAVFTTWQKEKLDMQQKVTASVRSDLSLVMQQCNARLNDNYSETSKVKHELKRIMAKLSGEDPDAVPQEPPVTFDSLPFAEQAEEQPSVVSTPVSSTLSASATPFTSVTQTPPASLASLAQQLATLASRHQAAGQPINMSVLQQFMASIPKNQQQQLQALIQQKAKQAATQQSPAVPPGMASPVPGMSNAPAPASKVLCPFFSTFAWCKFQDKCKYVHMPTGKEPLRDLPPSTIAHLQSQLTAGAGINGNVLANVLAAAASRTGTGSSAILQQLQQAAAAAATAAGSTAPPAPASTSPAASSSVSHAMISAQIEAQKEGLSMGPKAKTISCRFASIGRCAYGERCAYSHASTAPSGGSSSTSPYGNTSLGSLFGDYTQFLKDDTAAAAAAAWSKPLPEEETQIFQDGEDDEQYDQWNDATFGAEDALPPPPGLNFK